MVLQCCTVRPHTRGDPYSYKVKTTGSYSIIHCQKDKTYAPIFLPLGIVSVTSFFLFFFGRGGFTFSCGVFCLEACGCGLNICESNYWPKTALLFIQKFQAFEVLATQDHTIIFKLRVSLPVKAAIFTTTSSYIEKCSNLLV